MSTEDYTSDIRSLCEKLGCDPRRGLSGADASARLLALGPNALLEKDRNSAFHILLRQLTEIMVLVLIAAAGISLWLQ
jgi:Ca2+-transporting ATPase